MRGGGAANHHHHDDDDDDDDDVPWLHYHPVVDDDDDADADTAPLPPDYCAALLSGLSDHLPPPAAAASRVDPDPCSSSQGAVVPSTSTPLFSDQRMAWLHPPKPSPRAAAPPPPPPLAPTTRHRLDTAAATATVAQRLPPSEARAPDAPPPAATATATTSSVCSGNGDRRQLNWRDSHNNQSAEWSASQDELDLDDELAGVHRRSAARSSKRSRTAEVHNLSERRRRDRINEKMRALQELIPNCNKIDKASMLEEAIEYLKTLQLQVQMMSMGTGMFVPPMMLPAAAAAMQHHHMQMQQMAGPMAAAAHFPHLGAAAAMGPRRLRHARRRAVPLPDVPRRAADVHVRAAAAAAAVPSRGRHRRRADAVSAGSSRRRQRPRREAGVTAITSLHLQSPIRHCGGLA
ncbi:hypothetical protein OsJ_17053 [Oryza sativa Japonica Group]|uniref:BHLH domain-containing protein n=1 Tax=Oryza sativa subsp. japonica TaxID=39947 RepID=B9FMC7_ORYSJ|nr:hypothetical protein OsJ_17053 [Oryza sativa Japonica Group]